MKSRMKSALVCAAMLSLAIIAFAVGLGHARAKTTHDSELADTNKFYQMGFAAGLKSHQPPQMSSIPMPLESTNWSSTDDSEYTKGFAMGMAGHKGMSTENLN